MFLHGVFTDCSEAGRETGELTCGKGDSKISNDVQHLMPESDNTMVSIPILMHEPI